MDNNTDSNLIDPELQLTAEEKKEIDERCEALAKKYVVSKVNAIVFIDAETKERKICFLKEPNFPTKIAMMDKATTIGIFVAANELREATVLKDESDAITYGDASECDDYKMGVNNFCAGFIRSKQIAYKKK